MGIENSQLKIENWFGHLRHNPPVTSPLSVRDARRSILLLGFSTVIAQALLLREAMAAMGGSEMAWGVVMALWLIGMSVGARVGIEHGTTRTAAWAPAAVLAMAALGIIALRAAPALTGAAAGEALTTASAAWLWLASIVPAALAGGLAFPILAHELGPGGGGPAYSLEAAGCLAGGTLLSIALVWTGAATTLSLGLGAMVAFGLWRRSRTWAIAAAGLAAAIAWPAGEQLAQAGWKWSGVPGELGAWVETRHQEITISAGKPIAVYANGRLLASYPDPYTILPRAHLLMLLHPDPQRVFAVGCVADGSVEAMIRHPVERLTVVEDDPDLLRRIGSWYGPGMQAALTDPRLRAVTADPGRAVADGGPWDLVILHDGDPDTLRRNRTRTLEFFERCRSHMAADGVLVLRVGVADTYLGGAAGRLLSILASTIAEVFGPPVAIPGEEILLIAGGPDAVITLDPAILRDRLERRGLDEGEFVPEMIPLLLDENRAADISAHLDLGAPPNTARHPRAVLLAAALHEARKRPDLLHLARTVEGAGRLPLAAVLAILVAGVLTATRCRALRAPAGAAVVGCCSMGWWLLLLAGWQAARGSVYSEIGGLTAVFMAGTAAGAAIASRRASPERGLPMILAAGCALSLSLATGVTVLAPLATVPILLAAAGLLTGFAFPGLAVLASRTTRRGAGIAFAADEAGAGAAALAVGIFVIPWAGFTATAAALFVLQLAAIAPVAAALGSMQPVDA